ncbi:hypothetical protein O1Q96_34335 [Streptomyces sp. Qhu-G9]|nr:hypothetical protein [Streptomyces aurantiacus]WAU84323.1 hypothetical protein O1Q96_34335 [Streptomyces aurantiacus]
MTRRQATATGHSVLPLLPLPPSNGEGEGCVLRPTDTGEGRTARLPGPRS